MTMCRAVISAVATGFVYRPPAPLEETGVIAGSR